MKITVVPTSTMTEMNGVRVRLWKGQTESGIPVMLGVYQLIVDEEDRQAEFERDLKEVCPPHEMRQQPLSQVLAIPWRMVT